ncbi:glycoside hydrolase family protein [Neobacillus drentensis]|uniref:glycoside hydrolase family protein n=1 Tax=Neobacillus drentensis TaxID=220684 RepID=UPI0023D917F2|nr:glycoside hydrolase family protein [Neobacillus drentensis]
MKISQTGIKLIQQFEGCLLVGYKDAVGVPTIGWGHTGGVVVGQRITQAKADELLKQDLKRFEDAVNKLGLKLNQNQFDALVSFAYNVGPGNLKKLVEGRSLNQVADNICLYCKAGGQTLNGLVKRRNAEKALFLKPVPVANPYPGHPVKQGSTNTIATKLIQKVAGAKVDGVFGPQTTAAVKAWQKKHGLAADGIIGPKTWSKMF